MKKPKEPNNLHYWLAILKDPKLTQDFLERGDSAQKLSINRAIKYSKWKRIQEEKV